MKTLCERNIKELSPVVARDIDDWQRSSGPRAGVAYR